MLVLNSFIPEYLDKIQATQTRNIIESLSTSTRISRPIPAVKKSTVINDYENIAYSDESEQGKVQVNKCDLLLGLLVSLRHSTTSGKIGYFWH